MIQVDAMNRMQSATRPSIAYSAFSSYSLDSSVTLLASLPAYMIFPEPFSSLKGSIGPLLVKSGMIDDHVAMFCSSKVVPPDGVLFCTSIDSSEVEGYSRGVLLSSDVSVT